MLDRSQTLHQFHEKYGLEKGKSWDDPTDFEEAIALAGNGRFHVLLLFVCGLCMVSVNMEITSTSFLLPAAQCDFGFSTEEKGLLNSMSIIGMISSSHMWGYLADTRGRRKILIISLLVDSAITIVSVFVSQFWLFLLLRFLNGFFILAAVSVVYTYLGEFHGPQTRSKSIVWVCIFAGVGSIIQPGLAWLVIPQPWSIEFPWYTFNSWRIFLLLCAIPGLFTAFILAMFFPESPKFLMAIDKHEEALHVLSLVYARNTGNSPQRFPVKSLLLLEDGVDNPAKSAGSGVLGILRHVWKQTVPLFVPPYLFKTILVCLIQFGLYASSNGLYLWLPDIFNHLATYSTLHHGIQGSVCLAYARDDISPFSNTTINEIELKVNDEVNFLCNIDEVLLKINNKIVPYEPDPSIVQCHNGSLWLSDNSSSLLSDVYNGSLVFDVLNQTTTPTECHADVDFTVFQNTLILGLATAVSLYCGGYLVGLYDKKVIIVTNLSIAGIAGVTLNYVYSSWEVLLVSGIFVVFSGMCISLLVTTVVDIFPTHLRAMAVCLSLMVGRLGSVCINVLMGTVLEVNCSVMMFTMGGISICCGLLSLLLPSPKDSLIKN